MDIKWIQEDCQRRLSSIMDKNEQNTTMLSSYIDAISTNTQDGNFLIAQELCFSLIRLLGEANEKRKFLEMLKKLEGDKK